MHRFILAMCLFAMGCRAPSSTDGGGAGGAAGEGGSDSGGEGGAGGGVAGAGGGGGFAGAAGAGGVAGAGGGGGVAGAGGGGGVAGAGAGGGGGVAGAGGGGGVAGAGGGGGHAGAGGAGGGGQGGASSEDIDEDGSLAGVDCNDNDPSIHPGAEEHCDGVDADCNGVDDDDYAIDASTWYIDSDADSYGLDGTGVVACENPGGRADRGSDCDDTDPAVLAPTVWSLDADLDGVGGPVTLAACAQPEGYVLVVGDCDDDDDTIYPGALERCVTACSADGVDDDCDNVADNGCPVVHGASIDVSEVWSPPRTHHIPCDTTIGNGATVTIQANTTIEFAAGAGLHIGDGGTDGRLVVAGAAGAEVRFTSASPSPAAGDWDGIVIILSTNTFVGNGIDHN